MLHRWLNSSRCICVQLEIFALKPFLKVEGALKRRFGNLTKGRANLERRQRKVLDIIEKVEEQQLNTMHRTIVRAQTLLNKLTTLSDDAIAAEM